MNELSLNQKIINRLILESYFIREIGLEDGKMGISIFFFVYGRYTNCDVYTTIGEELLDDVLNSLFEYLPIDFATGLCGIGWGIEYLLQNDYIKGDTSIIFEDIDQRVMEVNLCSLKKFSKEATLGGIYLYVVSRVSDAIRNHIKIPFDKTYIDEIIKSNSIFISLPVSDWIKLFPLSLEIVLRKCIVTDENYMELPLGLKNGLSGFLLDFIQKDNLKCNIAE